MLRGGGYRLLPCRYLDGSAAFRNRAKTAIVSSKIDCHTRQADGCHFVREIHTDDKGNRFIYDYIADEGADLSALLEAHVPMILRRATELERQ